MSDRSTGAVPAATAAPSGGLSFRNERVQRVRRLLSQHRARVEEGAFVVEGPKLVDAALASGAVVESVFLAPDVSDDGVAARAKAAGARVYRLGSGVMERVGSVITPQGVLAVCRRVDVALEQLKEQQMIVVCVDIRDPGNQGTVLRSAGASGVGAVICCKGTVDLYNAKCLRASAGSLFHQQVVLGGEPLDVLEELGTWGRRRVGAAPRDGTPYDQCDLTGPLALVFGNEGHGLPPAVEREVDEFVTVPMTGHAESLNVAMAATVVCFEAARQRRSSPLSR